MQTEAGVETLHKLSLNPSSAPQKASIGLKIQPAGAASCKNMQRELMALILLQLLKATL